jgi:hypothetical protein
MNRFMSVAALMAAALALLAPAAGAHKADPNYLTTVNGTPDGVRVTVVNRSDQLLLQNTSGKDVVIEGYEKDAYARVLADGTVEVNTASPAYYLNEDRFGTTKPPPGVTADSPAKWKALDKTGRFQWHDHRMHWMGSKRPPQVKDPEVKTKIYDWSVPVEVGGSPAAVRGSLFWTPTAGGGAPVGAIIALAAIVIALSILVIVVRRRRGAQGDPDGARAAAGGEAW